MTTREGQKTRKLERIKTIKMSDSEDDTKRDGTVKSYQVTPFTGKPSEYPSFKEKTLTRAEWYGYAKLLHCKKNEVGYDKIPTKQEIDAIEAKSTQDDDDKKVLAVHKLNKKGFMLLTLSIDTETGKGKTAFRLVKNSKTKEYPDGNCKMLWDRLEAKYARKSIGALMHLKGLYENSELGGMSNDPGDWISLLEEYRTQIEEIDASSAISDRDLMLHILNNLNPEYDAITDGLEDRIDATGDEKFTLKILRDKLCNRFERLEKLRLENRPHNSNPYEIAKFAKQFKGMCYNCGNVGHKGADCPEKKNGGSSSKRQFRNNGKCWFCEEEGHKIFECEKFVSAKNGIKEISAVAKVNKDESFDELGF